MPEGIKQVWTGEVGGKTDEITVFVAQVLQPTGRWRSKLFHALTSAESSLRGELTFMSPIVFDIQQALNTNKTVTPVFGYQKRED